MERRRTDAGEMLRDTLDMLILKTLDRRPMHGYGIAEFIEQRSEDVLRVEEGALYPALHRLELRGLLDSKWGLSDNNRRAKFYRLTAAGRKQLQRDSARWGMMSVAIGRIMETT
jgi:transcriptional regulator